MDLSVDKNGRYVVVNGSEYAIVCAVLENGNSPAKEALEDLEARQINLLALLLTRFQSAVGHARFHSLGFIKHEKGDLHTFHFVAQKYRIPFFRDGCSLVMTHGFFKQGQKWPPSQMERAERIMKEDGKRVERLR